MSLETKVNGDFGIFTEVNETLGDFTAYVDFVFQGAVNYAMVFNKAYDVGFWLGRNALANEFGGGIQQLTPPLGIFQAGMVPGTWYRMTRRRIGTAGTLRVNGITQTDVVPSTLCSSDRLYIGCSSFGPGAPGFNLSGIIGRCGIWDVGVTDGELDTLDTGWDLKKVRPQSLIWYSPFMSNEKNIFGDKTNGVGTSVFNVTAEAPSLRF